MPSDRLPDPQPDPHPDLVLRPALPEDAAAVAEVHLAARRAAPMPPAVHADDDVRSWLAGRLAPASGDEVWVAEAEGSVVGYARLHEDWLDDLYVHPRHQGQGVGAALLDLTKARRPGGFGLWVFERNTPARRFYARAGLVEVERTDGSGNEEGEPDVRVLWRGVGRGSGQDH